MLKIIKDSIAEKFVYENDSLEFSCTTLEVSLHKNEKIEGSFLIYGNGERQIEGFVITNGARMECLTNYFCDKEAEIKYCFDSFGLDEGEVLKGEISIVSNCGEYELPYVITILQINLESSLGPIKNLFHFTNLAKANWEEAVALFHKEHFARIFYGNDRQFLVTYRGLSKQLGNPRNVEEFLIEIHKKPSLEYIFDRQEISIRYKESGQKEFLTIQRQGWGYTHLEVKLCGTFLQADKSILTEQDFKENQCMLEIEIIESGLHLGNNWGEIQISSKEIKQSIPIKVQKVTDRRFVTGSGRRDKKQSIYAIMKSFLYYRMNRLGEDEWFKEASREVTAYMEQDQKEVTPKLYQAQLFLTCGKTTEAKQVLDEVELYLDGSKERPEIWCYYLYLTTLMNQEKNYVSEIREEIESAYQRDPMNWRIGWLILHIGEEYNFNTSKKWLFLEEQFIRDCRSPILYFEAISLLELKPTLLMKLEKFEIHLLNFAAKYKVLSREIMGQLHYLVSRMREFSPQIYQILVTGYEETKDVETLRGICTLLIKGNKTDSCYFKWFEKGVKEELRITLLYEYYMMTLPMNFSGKIPKIIKMYFAYQNNLDYRKNALLYCEIIKYREEYPEIYQSYIPNIERFVLEQIESEKINKELAILYNAILTPKIITPLLAEKLATLFFVQLIHVKEEEMQQVVVIYEKKLGEFYYPILNKTAAVPLYGSDYKLFLEDSCGVRYASEANYKIEKLKLSGRILNEVVKQVTGNLDLALYLSETGGSYGTLTLSNYHFIKSIVESSEVVQKEKSAFSMKLLHFYFENDCSEQLDEFLDQIEYEGLNAGDRSEVIRYMIVREMYDKAFDWVKRSGLEGLEAKTIVRLCSRMIKRSDMGITPDKDMLKVIFYAYKKGKYDEYILKFLVENFDGPIKEMQNIWKAARGFLINTYTICEKMIIQMLFTGSYIGERMTVFADYISGNAKVDVELAFISTCSYNYFIKEQFMETDLWKEITRLQLRGEPLNKVTKLAYLKHYSEEKEELSYESEKIVTEYIQEMLSSNIYFSFFSQFQKWMPELLPFADRTILEYKTHPNSKVVLHYLIEGESEANTHYQQEVMKDMYGGIFTKSLVLFFGECLQYYITEEVDRVEQLTESGSIQKSDIANESQENRFNMINDIAVAIALQDYDTINTLAKEYFEKDYLANELFHIM